MERNEAFAQVVVISQLQLSCARVEPVNKNEAFAQVVVRLQLQLSYARAGSMKRDDAFLEVVVRLQLQLSTARAEPPEADIEVLAVGASRRPEMSYFVIEILHKPVPPHLVACPDSLEEMLYQHHRTALLRLVSYAVPNLVIDLNHLRFLESQASRSPLQRSFRHFGKSCKDSGLLTHPIDAESMSSQAESMFYDGQTSSQVHRVAYYSLTYSLLDLQTL